MTQKSSQQCGNNVMEATTAQSRKKHLSNIYVCDQ